METGINEVVKDGKGNAILYTALLAAVVANVMPTPFDSFYFSQEQKNKSKLEEGLITPAQYWKYDMLGYYGWTAAWYMSLFIILQAVGGEFKNNARILVVIASGGLLYAVYNKNVQRDNELQDLHQQQQQALLKRAGVKSVCCLGVGKPSDGCVPAPPPAPANFNGKRN